MNPDFDEGYVDFLKVERLYRRYIKLRPKDWQGWDILAWLIYSRWSHSIWEPEKYPTERENDKKVVAIYRDAFKKLPRSALLHKGAGDQFRNMSRYKNEYYKDAINHYKKGLIYADSDPMKVRLGLNIGHLFRLNQLPEQAKIYYRGVLKVQPTNKVALKFLKKLEDSEPISLFVNERF